MALAMFAGSAGALAQHSTQVNVGYAGCATPEEFQGDCVPMEMRARIAANLALYEAMYHPLSRQLLDAPVLYPIFPQGGTVHKDLTFGNYVDLDPTANTVTNYLCTHYGNDGHQGCDSGSPTWQEMAIGMPIFAALDGTVVDAHDGDFDMNTSCQSGGNYVIIDHGNGRTAWYFHMKSGSVAVHVNDVVRAGQQLGLVGSSGCSFGPHLHFQSMDNLTTVYEPFAGACHPGASGWVHQIDPPASVYLRDFGVTSQNIGTASPLPDRPPTSKVMTFADGDLFYWIEMGNLPANSTWTERYIRPDGSLEYSLGPFNFGNPDTYGWALYWFDRNVGGMHSIAGTWHIQFDINGTQVIDAPVTVMASAPPAGFNRAPLALTASFDPPAPQPSDVVFARITSDAAIRDPDFDLVRYHYVWKVNGTTIRDVVAVGMADAIPRNSATANQVVECTITPSDGVINGPSTTIRVASGCYANCDASTGSPSLTAADFTCFLNRFRASDAYANCDGSTGSPSLTAGDFTCFLTKFRAGCP